MPTSAGMTGGTAGESTSSPVGIKLVKNFANDPFIPIFHWK